MSLRVQGKVVLDIYWGGNFLGFIKKMWTPIFKPSHVTHTTRPPHTPRTHSHTWTCVVPRVESV